jgi:DNA-binding SARP family transcriptional activator
MLTLRSGDGILAAENTDAVACSPAPAQPTVPAVNVSSTVRVRDIERGEARAVRICLLGRFEILRHGSPIPLRPGGKVEQLIGVLSVRSRNGISREALLEEVWPGSDVALAGHSLNSMTHWLKQQLGDALGRQPPVRRSAGRYSLALDGDLSLDVIEFERFVDMGHRCSAAGDIDAAVCAYDEALELYAGDLSSGPGVLFLLERERLRSRYLSIMASLAEHFYALGNYSESMKHALGLLYADPCREDAHRMVMRSYVRAGQRAQALRHFDTCRTILAREFDAVPESATVALFEAIRKNPDNI